MKRRNFLAAGFASVIASREAFSANADASLYEAAPPPDSAFVRIVNAKSDGAGASVSVGATKFGSVAIGGASAYRPIKAGKVAVMAGAATPSLTLGAGGFYSIVVKGATGRETALMILDPALTTRVQSLLIFYNCTTKPLIDLKTAGGAASIFSGVAPGKVASRLVNPAKSGFQVASGDKSLASVAEQSIARGSAYSVVAVEANGKVSATWIQSETRNK